VDVGEHGFQHHRIQGFEAAEGNELSDALTVRLEIEQKDAEAVTFQDQRAPGRRTPVGPRALHKDDSTAAAFAVAEPAAEHGAGR
jgi:hypothetical protein